MSDTTDSSATIAFEAQPEVINASCRGPVLFLFFSAALWLVDAAGIGVLGSFKVHMPGFLADCPLFTYGRLQANAWVAFLFGFAGNAGLGITLWMLSRLRGMPLARPGFVVAGTILWNAGVTAAMVGISLGDQSGVAGLELPKYASRVLLIGQAFIAFSAILTYFSRRHKQLYPSTWYLIASLVAFPWIIGTAHWLLVEAPVRGAAQIPLGHWAATSLVQIWLGCIGLAAVIYFIPKIIQRELYSRQWTFLGFWMLLLLGGWVNLNSGAPLPVWQIKLSQLASGFFLLVVIAVSWNLRQTLKGVPLLSSEDLTLRFMGFALSAWIVAGLLTFCNVCPSWNAILQFTYANTAIRHLFAWGFFAMSMIGAVYYVAPRLIGPTLDWPCARIYHWIYRFIAVGVVIVVLAGVGMAYRHGLALQSTGIESEVLQSRALMPMRAAFLGEVLFLVGSLIFLGSMLCLLVRNCCGECSLMSLWRQCRSTKVEGGAK